MPATRAGTRPWIRAPAALVPAYSALAPAYDRTVGVRDFLHTRAAFEALVRRYRISFASAADLGCGTGLFAGWLARRHGIPVLGIDRSPGMLAVARRRAGLPGLRFLRQDLRRLRLPAPVDLVTANTFTLNHLLVPRDLAQAFRAIRAALRPGGHLLFDLVTPCQPWAASQVYQRAFRIDGRDVLYRLRWDARRRLLHIAIVHRGPASSPVQVELYVGRGYPPLGVARLLRSVGFEVLGIHDADTLEMASGCPPRVMIVARVA
jgi:SAM-dependent methyltransferase